MGESKVQMDRKEDGHLKVTIRPARTLSPSGDNLNIWAVNPSPAS